MQEQKRVTGYGRTPSGTLAAPFPYFGGKSGVVSTVWGLLGEVRNYVEPFAGSAAMLLGSPDGKRVSTINDADGFVANFWRAIAYDADAVAHHADWPCNEIDLFARHSWLVRQSADLTARLHADPEWFDVKIAGWWCWGACNWIGSGWCSGTGPWIHDGNNIIDSRQLPHLGNAGQGINRQLPHLGDAGQGINRKLPHLGNAGQGDEHHRSVAIREWFRELNTKLRDVRVTCGDWSRVVKDSVTTRHGLTGVFLDPPYTKGALDYAVKSTGGVLAREVQAWCAASGHNARLRIVLCGHAGEHDALLRDGWFAVPWKARKGYATTDEAVGNSASETLWCSPHCVGAPVPVGVAENCSDLFDTCEDLFA